MHSNSHTDTTIIADTATNRLPRRMLLKNSPLQSAITDIVTGLQNYHIWLMLGYHDIKLRYRRSILGPFWITLSMAITVYFMGFLYSHLFHNDMASYFPFLAAGMLAWALVSTAILEITEAYIQSENLIKQIKLPYSIYIHRIIWRNILIFFHNLAVMLPIFIIFHQAAAINFYSLLLIPHLFIFYINAFCYGLIIAIIGSRYRDLSQMIKSLVQVAFFMTPIMWKPSALAEKYQPLIIGNPFYAFVELIRAPMIGTAVPLAEYYIAGLTTIVGLFLCIYMFSKYRARIVYWL